MNFKRKTFILVILFVLVFFLLLFKADIGTVTIDNSIKMDLNIENKNIHYNDSFVYMEGKTLVIILKRGDMFSGTNIIITKFGGYYVVDIDDYDDNLDDNRVNRYKILTKKLILDKINYKQGDSIFGKISLDIMINDKKYIINEYSQSLYCTYILTYFNKFVNVDISTLI